MSRETGRREEEKMVFEAFLESLRLAPIPVMELAGDSLRGAMVDGVARSSLYAPFRIVGRSS